MQRPVVGGIVLEQRGNYLPDASLCSEGESSADTPSKTAKDSLALELEPLVSEGSPEPVHLDIPRPKRAISQESDLDSDYSPPTTVRKPHKGTTFAQGTKLGHQKQLSLYSWLSSPPTTSPSLSKSKTAGEGDLGRKTAEQLKGDKRVSNSKFCLSLCLRKKGSKLDCFSVRLTCSPSNKEKRSLCEMKSIGKSHFLERRK